MNEQLLLTLKGLNKFVMRNNGCTSLGGIRCVGVSCYNCPLGTHQHGYTQSLIFKIIT